MKRLAIFDLDGTLFDTDQVNYCAYKQALEKSGYHLTSIFYQQNCVGKHYKEFLKKLHIANDDFETIHEYKKQAYKLYLEKAVPNMHLFAIINGIKNQYYIALVTTASRENCMELLQFYNVQDCFDLIITQEDVEEVKPAPEGFIKAMSFFNVIPQNTIVFEDSEAGIEAALRSKACVVKIEK